MTESDDLVGYEKVLINNIHEIFVIPRFTFTSHSEVTINNKRYPTRFVLDYMSHLVEVLNYDIIQFNADILSLCVKPLEHGRNENDRTYTLHLTCFLKWVETIPVTQLIDPVYKLSARSVTVFQKLDDYPVVQPRTVFVGHDGHTGIRINLQPGPVLISEPLSRYRPNLQN